MPPRRSKKPRPNYGLTPDELERAVRKIEKKARRETAIPWDGTVAGLRDETTELLNSPAARKTLRAARAGKLKYKPLDLADENFGL